MAKFRREKSDLAESLDKLQGFAENLISLETTRRIQLGREKEARMVTAYQVLLNTENDQIAEYELALDSIEQNLLDRGVELESIDKAHKSVDSKALLEAANEGAMEMVMAQLEDSKAYKVELEKKKRDAQAIKRHIDMFDNAISMVDPGFAGEERIVEAEDVAEAAMDFIDANDQYIPEVGQRLKAHQTEAGLEALQADYYSRLETETKQKLIVTQAEDYDSRERIHELEGVVKETGEALEAMTANPLRSIREEYGAILTRQYELDDDTLTTAEITAKEDEIVKEKMRIGIQLFPWATEDKVAGKVEDLQMAIVQATGNPKKGITPSYGAFLDYFKEAHGMYSEYVKAGNTLADTLRANIQAMFGIDITNTDWISQLEEFEYSGSEAQIQQAGEQLKISGPLMPPPSKEVIDYELERFFND